MNLRKAPNNPQLRASDLARRYGFTARYWVKLAADGRIPGARQPFGPRGTWLFDGAAIAKWWDARQREVVAWPGYTVKAKSGGGAPNVRAENTAEAYKQQTERLLKSVLGIGSVKLKRSRGATSRGDRSSRRTTNSFAST